MIMWILIVTSYLLHGQVTTQHVSYPTEADCARAMEINAQDKLPFRLGFSIECARQ